MAKKTKSTKVLDFATLSSKIDEFSSFGGMINDQEYGRIKDWIPTGNYALNALISADIYKGIPAGRITILSGPSQTGKTYMALNIAREAQRKGYEIIWLDSENAFNSEQAISNFKIDPARFRHELVYTISEVTTYCKKLTDLLLKHKEDGGEVPKIMIVIDSFGNLATNKEVNDALNGNDKVDMTRAKEIKSFFRIVTSEIAKLDIPVVGVNHVYENISAFYGGQIQSGGSGIAYLPSVNVVLNKAQYKENNATESIGITVTARLAKARFSAPYHPIKFQILFGKGMNKFIGLENFMTKETFDILGFGPGRIDDKGNYTYVATEFPAQWALKDERRNTTRKMVYRTDFWSEDRLNKLNEMIKVEMAYKSTLSEEEDLVLGDDDMEDDDEVVDE